MGDTLAIEEPTIVPKAVYISKRSVSKDPSHLKQTARYLYPLLNVREFLDERLGDKKLISRAKSLMYQLAKVRKQMKSITGFRNPRLPKVQERILQELEMVERTKADETLVNVELWGNLYLQYGEHTNAYRPYYYEVGTGYVLYIQVPLEESSMLETKLMVVSDRFDDRKIEEIVASWCGVDEQKEVEELPVEEQPEEVEEEAAQ